MVLGADEGTQAYQARQDEIGGILRRSEHCQIDRERLSAVAEVMRQLPASYVMNRSYSSINLRPSEFPDQTVPVNNHDAIQYSFVTGAQGFFIWVRDSAGHATPWSVTVGGRQYLGAPGLYACHMRALKRGLNILDPIVLEAMTPADVAEYYRDEATGMTTLQHPEGRLAKFRETGTVLTQRFGGHFANLLAEADGWLFRDNGKGVIQLLSREFPVSYGDWPFAKLTMVIARGLHQRREAQAPSTSEFDGLTDFRDSYRFDCGADYYRPLFLMRVGVIRISDEFRTQLAKEEVIESGSSVEEEYRAATIVACARLSEEAGTDHFTPAAESWETAFRRCRLCVPGIAETELGCPYFHTCRAYNGDSELLSIRWPLTYTLSH